MNEVLFAFLSKTLNMESEALHKLVKTDEGEFKQDALESLLELDKTRVANIKQAETDKGKELFNNGYAKGKQESLSNFEGEIKTNFGVDSNLKGMELIHKLIDSKKESKTDVDVTKTPEYISLMSKHQDELTSTVKEWEDKYNARENELKEKETFNTIKSRTNPIIDSLNLSLSTDPIRASKQKQVILNELKSYNYQIDGEKIIPLNSDGTAMRDEHNHLVPFKSLVSNIATGYYDVVNDSRTSSGGDAPEVRSSSTARFVNEQDFMTKVAAAKTSADKMELVKAWDSQNNNNN